ncbi:MAG: CYTH and CHAD domain-containing protein, partial [Nocardioidaceae bacterium]|nr:CYTH and CHAD domain-containing protein [Nocardioidaceae bacterium]
MASVHREVERKYEPSAHTPLPSLDDLPDVSHVGTPAEQELEAVYFDTSDLALAAAGITVRRRTGGDDVGWHLKLPAGDGVRDELRVPLGRAKTTVPKALRAAVRVHARDRPMAAVATVRTHRTVLRLLDSEGRSLAQVCDDNVTAETPAPAETGSVTAWREWEVELVEGGTSLLDAADELFLRAGAAPAARTSKLARVLGDRVPRDSATTTAALRTGGPAAAVVHARLCEQVAELKLRDPEVRRDVPDGVHKMRVALRRLRSALATFRPLVDQEVTEPLREELKWIGGVLGDARDAEVMHGRLTTVIARESAEPAEPALAAVTRRVDDELHATHRSALTRALEAMETDRYFRLLDDLDHLVADPPWTPLARQPANHVLPGHVHHDWKRLRRHVAAAKQATGRAQRDERLHEVRKAAKRTRYAAETLTSLYGRDARRLVKATKRVQSLLGTHQDSVLTQALLRQLGQAHLDGDNGFIYGRLHA